MLRTYTVPFAGFDAVQPQFAPPCAPGIETVSFSDGGVKSPSFFALAMRSFQVWRSSGVRMNGSMSFFVRRCRANGGGPEGNGCVGHACSPGILLDGTRRSWIGQIG